MLSQLVYSKCVQISSAPSAISFIACFLVIFLTSRRVIPVPSSLAPGFYAGGQTDMDRCVELTRDAHVSSHNDASQLGLDDLIDRTTPTNVLALMNTSILVAAAGDVMFCAVEWCLNAYDTFVFRITRALAQAVEGCCVGDGTLIIRYVRDIELSSSLRRALHS
jgi:hypothetical protein